MDEQRFIAFNPSTDAVEAIGTHKEVIDKLSENFGAAQLAELQIFEIIGKPLKVKMVLVAPKEPPL
jgi:hypothetical protein